MKRSIMEKAAKKSQFRAVLLCVLAAALAAGYGACASIAPIPAGWGDPALVELSGTGIGTAPGYSSEITLALTVENGMIVDVRIEAPGETPNIGTPAIERSRRFMLRNNAMEVDIISGASITCIGINAAAQAALDQIRASH
jgi:Na+-translocating ferredoxin:NAD+ oxidoreductase RnfG subunit